MPELGFQDQNQLRSSFRARDASPDSVIFTLESNFSLFSSASVSDDRSSFASDPHDHDSISSEISQHLSGHDTQESSSGPDPNLNKHTVHKNSRISRRKVDKAKPKLPKSSSSSSSLRKGNGIALLVHAISPNLTSLSFGVNHQTLYMVGLEEKDMEVVYSSK